MQTFAEQSTNFRIQAINAIKVPLDLSQRSTLWNMAESGEIVDSSITLRAIAIYDILDSPYDTQELYSKYGHLLYHTPYQCSFINIIAHMTMQQIASFMGY